MQNVTDYKARNLVSYILPVYLLHYLYVTAVSWNQRKGVFLFVYCNLYNTDQSKIDKTLPMVL